MAFPWSVIRKTSLASGNIVEDMQLSVELAITGHAPVFCASAQVRGLLPQQRQAAKSQRTRWEHGHLQTLLTQVPRLLKASWHQKRFEPLAIALDLCVPPLSLLVMLWVVTTSGALLIGCLWDSWFPTILLAVEGLLIMLSIVGAWAKYAREDLPLLSLLTIPLYVLWKIPLYFAFLMQPQTKWVRTQRDVVDASQS
jgi:cellulose synthase/poly-beta-1,6-N-acetylglucosamine synthase-like glycosyltransferase